MYNEHIEVRKNTLKRDDDLRRPSALNLIAPLNLVNESDICYSILVSCNYSHQCELSA